MYYITQIGEKLNPEPYPALIRRFSQHIPVPVPLPDTHRSCSAYRKPHHGSTGKPRNDKRILTLHLVKDLAVWQSTQ